MSLTLKVVTFKGQPPQESMTICFGRRGGTVGRSAKNNFVLPDPDRYISRQHAVISCEDGVYYLKDTSLSGSYIRNKKIVLHQNKIELQDGDRIEIGDYELLVGVGNFEDTQYVSVNDFDAEIDSSLDAVGKTGELRGPGGEIKKYGDFEAAVKFIDQKIEEAAFKHPMDSEIKQNFPNDFGELIAGDREVPIEVLDTSLFFDPGAEPLNPNADGAPPRRNDSPLPTELDVEVNGDDASADVTGLPSDLLAAEDDIPEFQTALAPPIDGDTGESEAPAVTPGAAADINGGNVLKSSSQSQLFKFFLESAGIKDDGGFSEDELPEVMQIAGSIFRELIEGLVRLINGRAEAKNQLRLEGTILGPIGNNPFKFVSDTGEIIKILLRKKQDGYVSGIQAVRQSHADIISHQVAMTVGIQAALKKVLKQFDPEPYNQNYKKSPLILRKNRCWDAYCNNYPNIVINILENFLGDEFIRAYEEQVEKLKNAD